jgi:hypothetical protein
MNKTKDANNNDTNNIKMNMITNNIKMNMITYNIK